MIERALGNGCQGQAYSSQVAPRTRVACLLGILPTTSRITVARGNAEELTNSYRISSQWSATFEWLFFGMLFASLMY